MKHLMIDLETLGTRHTSVFLSIAAVSFELNADEQREDAAIFNATIDLNSALETGLTVDADTIKWWMTQDSKIRAKMFQSGDYLAVVLVKFSEFFESAGIVYPWGNSASFDLGILSNAYRKIRLNPPWRYTNERCYRTAMALLPPVNIDRENAHDPLADCYYQIKKLQLAYAAHKMR